MPQKTQEPLRSEEPIFHTPSPLAKRTFLYPLCMGHFYCGEDYCVDRGRYDSFLMMVIVKGTGYVETAGEPGQRRRMQAGQAVFIDCYEPHVYGAEEELEFYWMHFDGINARAYFHYLTEEYGTVLTVKEEYLEKLIGKFELLQEALSSEQGLGEQLLGFYVTDMLTFPAGAVLVELSAEGEETGGQMLAQELGRTVSYMRRHFSENITVEELAEGMAVSAYHYIRLFKKQYGITPHQYLMTMRLDCARFLLRSGEKTVKQIAFSCGFQSENNFCVAFKKQTGITPTEYRKGEACTGSEEG